MFLEDQPERLIRAWESRNPRMAHPWLRQVLADGGQDEFTTQGSGFHDSSDARDTTRERFASPLGESLVRVPTDLRSGCTAESGAYDSAPAQPLSAARGIP